jgi:RNase P subunit RPR2
MILDRVKRGLRWISEQVKEQNRLILEKKKHQRLLKDQGFLTFCFNCGGLLNDDGQCPMNPRYGIYVYTCEKCGKRSTFDMLAPVPLRMDS